ncbi:hypothetical protein QBC47DRAFT_409582 [Echria macrotheca]|uniref:Protein NO VEIN C-terminal domain-containing protein n=1 Tax=Echria macrotheca TaxID=438768 RepID=A0AAJ0BR38_9PEZI|nr:hypothetical protein QBC47DRAFT_409582 [Echria macrotheca]
MEQPAPSAEAVAAARELVGRIAWDHGHLAEEHYSKIPDPVVRRMVKDAMGKKDAMIGSSIVTLAKELYTKDVRFIFELLQNADDNDFEYAKLKGHKPYVIFRIYHDQIVVDCNEDGFKEENLRAICDVGKSSKVGQQGYIGEKGIGFKAVFAVAWKVHIQSGAYSFSFKHRRGDSGMGMVSPEWHPAAVLPEPMTRMTFTLHDDGDGNVRAAQRRRIIDEFEQLQPTMMLFLKKLKRIEIRFFDESGREIKGRVMTHSLSGQPNRAVLETLVTGADKNGGNDAVSSRHRLNYHVTKGTAAGLARNENRSYSAKEEASQVYSTAEIVLAFPLDDNSVPIDRPQSIFAFLPVRQAGFNFLIHSDFVTSANREDIVTSSLRNQGIRKHIASTFVSAVEQMCKHPQLRFQWMHFLPPPPNIALMDGFWTGFVDLLKTELLGARVMFPRTEAAPQRTIGQLRTLPQSPVFHDRHGEPLFDDLGGDAAIYISRHYRDADLSLLRPYGLQDLSFPEILDRLEADLNKGTSKMKSRTADDDWHSRVANMLIYPFGRPDFSCYTSRIRKMALIPLKSGGWVNSGNNPPRYFPTTSTGTQIPPGLNICLICPSIAKHPDRKKLFLTLDVEIITDDRVRSKILKEYEKIWPSLFDSIAWMKFLYMTEAEDTKPAECYSQVSIVSSTDENLEPVNDDVYFPDDESEYGAAKLGLNLKFLNVGYLEDPPVRPGNQAATAKQSWKQWLHNAIGIRERLRLVTSGGSAISEEVLYVAQHRPGRFFGLISYLWPHEGEKVIHDKVIREKFITIEVICDGGKKHPLHATILPTPQLKTLSSRFLRADEHLPFLELPHTSWDGNTWGFLETLGVMNDDSLQFYLGMLRCIVTKTGDATNLEDPSRLLDLYKAIHGKCIASSSLELSRNIIRQTFSIIRGIYVPRLREGDFSFWESPEGCLLGAPPDLAHKVPIDVVYDQAFGKAVGELEAVKQFLHDTLAVAKLGWRDYIAELEYIRDEDVFDTALSEAQYKRLKAARLDAGDTKKLRNLFGNQPLICFHNGDTFSWHRPEECLWSTGTGVKSLVNLAQVYDHDLETFFVRSLGVTRLTAKLIYEELLSLGDGSQRNIKLVKEKLLVFSSLLREETKNEPLVAAPLLEKYILPIRHAGGELSLLPATTGFTIIDRAGPMAQFRNVAKTLDFTMEEVHDLEPFISWAGLGNRYLSRMVEEVPDLGSGEKFRVSEPRYNLKKKAHALVRIAKYIRSPRFSGNGQALYDLLRTSETWETDDISSRLTLTIDGQKHSIKLKHGDVYMTGEDTQPLKIFIPHDEIAQDVCVQHNLPRKLVDWLMMHHDGQSRPSVSDRAVGIVKGLLNARLASIPKILMEEGIHDIDLGNRDADAPEPVLITEPSRAPLRLTSRSPSPSTPERVFTPVPSTNLETPMTDPFSSPSPSFFPNERPAASRLLFPQERRPVQEPQAASGVDLYRELLDHMIKAGKRVPFPTYSKGVFDMSGLAEALGVNPGGDTSTVISSSNFSTVQLGAAGELFVFEMLKSLEFSVPGFCWQNWTSNIKKQVTVHPDYEGMGSWGGGAELSDLQYTDRSGIFTDLLVRTGHLSDNWAGKRPSYYLEVKSTPRTCDEPFYMSGLQYKKMTELCTDGDEKVYIIFRVFDMFSDRVNVKLYVNPVELERRGVLDFSTDTYTVRARA